MAHTIIRSRYNPLTQKKEITALCDNNTTDIAAVGTDWSAGSIIQVTDGEFPVYVLSASGAWETKEDE